MGLRWNDTPSGLVRGVSQVYLSGTRYISLYGSVEGRQERREDEVEFGDTDISVLFTVSILTVRLGKDLTSGYFYYFLLFYGQ